jgi:hypothetical protein
LDSTREERGEKGEGVRQRSSGMARKEFFKRWLPSQLGEGGTGYYSQLCHFQNTNIQGKCQIRVSVWEHIKTNLSYTSSALV